MIFAKAALDDPRFIHLVADREKRYEILSSKIMRQFVTQFFHHTSGLWGVFKGDRLVAVSVWANPDFQNRIPTILMLKNFVFGQDMKLKRGLSLMSLMAKCTKKAKKIMGTTNLYAIFYVAVDPEFQSM